MKKEWLAVSLVCVSLILCACGGASSPDALRQPPELETEAEMSGESEPDAATGFENLAGTWRADTGFSVLTIYENGGFVLNGSDEDFEGSLAYTEADGDVWESGPRYEMYLENNERLSGRFLAFDDAYPGKLVYAVGGGAEFFSRTDSAYDADGALVRVQWEEESGLSGFAGYDEFDAYGGEYEAGIVFSATRAVRNFQFLSVILQDTDEISFAVETLYEQDILTPERPLLVRTSFPGDMPSNGISLTDGSGLTRYFAIGESGLDDSLVMSEFTWSGTP